jgi:hypothetical protein
MRCLRYEFIHTREKKSNSVDATNVQIQTSDVVYKFHIEPRSQDTRDLVRIPWDFRHRSLKLTGYVSFSI